MEHDPLVGKQLGAYLIQRKIGEGGMAQVYKAYHARLRRDVAIKVILPQVADKAGFRERFEREAQLVASLEHQHIVAVYDFGEIGNLTYLVMQYVGGGTLRDQLQGGRPIQPRQATLCALQMARALHHAHLRGIVHRDVKPQNMLVSSSDPNQLLLSDFGIAKLYLESRREAILPTIAPGSAGNLASDPALTSADQMIGTAGYMAPEQINRKAVDARTDVYALGVVLFQMLTGQMPFHSATIYGLLFQHVYTLPPSVREINPYVPEALAQITARALAKAPEDRFQSAGAMAEALEVLLVPVTNQLSAPLTSDGAIDARLSVFPSQQRVTSSQSAYGEQQTGPAAVSSRQIVGGGSSVAPIQARSKRKFRVNQIVYWLAAILTVAVLILKIFFPMLFSQITPPTSSRKATSFVEDFHDNSRGWQRVTQGDLTTTISSNTYMLTVAKDNVYFPYPQAVGTLPDNFILSVEIRQDQGDANVLYGLAFRLRCDPAECPDRSKQYSYAFVIDRKGEAKLLKYNPDAPPSPSTLQSYSPVAAIDGALHHVNTLQVTIQGNFFFLAVNGMQLNGPNDPITDNSGTPPYTGGEPGLMVSGSSASETSFVVTLVKLMIS